MLILVTVFAWFTVSLVFRCVICWFDFHFTIELNFFNIVFRMMLIFFCFLTWNKWFYLYIFFFLDLSVFRFLKFQSNS